MKTTNPFFSLVIPCYNDGRYAPNQYLDRLLSNLVEQAIPKEDLEVIISDDNSFIPYPATIAKYSEELNIKFVQTDYRCCPGNTRQKGADAATGQWLCFADHDDLFYPNAFKIVEDAIENTREQHLVCCSFDKVDFQDTNKVVEEFRPGNLGTWVHGKFYNRENFWNKCNLHFIKDLKTHEDLALGRLTECALHFLGTSPTYINTPVYKWTYNTNSISHSTYLPIKLKGVNYGFVEVHFDDFLESQVGAILEGYKCNLLSKEEATVMSLIALFSSYMSICTFKQSHPKKYLRSPEAYCSRMWSRMKKELEFTLPAVKVWSKSFTGLKTAIDRVNRVALDCNQPLVISWIEDKLEPMDYECVLEAEFNQFKNCSANPIKPSSIHRPFFSIIVPCYNDGRYKEGIYLDRLLTSISHQGIDKEDLEVILADDCSPVSFDYIMSRHEDEMTLKYIKTDYNFAPGNTRAKGLTIATGEWLAFADHDDIYYDGALTKIRNAILEKDEKHFAFGDFYGVDPSGKVIRKYECHLNWCHGKFYNKDNFWDKYGIHFIHDLKSHEDIAICTQVSCALARNVPNYTYLHVPVYAWTDNPQSVSHAKYTVDTESGPREFLEVFFGDYLTATGYVYLEQFKDHTIKMQYAIKCCLEIMCYSYFYTQGFQFRRPEDFYRKNLDIAGTFIDRCKKAFNLTNETIYNAIASNSAYMYYNIRKYADGGSGRYIPTQTLKQWLELVSPEH